MSRTGLAELGVGLAATYMFCWMFPIGAQLQTMIVADPASSSALKINAAIVILVLGLYGLIGAFCLISFFEMLVLRVFDAVREYYLEYHRGWL